MGVIIPLDMDLVVFLVEARAGLADTLFFSNIHRGGN